MIVPLNRGVSVVDDPSVFSAKLERYFGNPWLKILEHDVKCRHDPNKLPCMCRSSVSRYRLRVKFRNVYRTPKRSKIRQRIMVTLSAVLRDSHNDNFLDILCVTSAFDKRRLPFTLCNMAVCDEHHHFYKLNPRRFECMVSLKMYLATAQFSRLASDNRDYKLMAFRAETRHRPIFV